MSGAAAGRAIQIQNRQRKTELAVLGIAESVKGVRRRTYWFSPIARGFTIRGA